eukprot:1140012-Rhodomonas_salina.1
MCIRDRDVDDELRGQHLRPLPAHPCASGHTRVYKALHTRVWKARRRLEPLGLWGALREKRRPGHLSAHVRRLQHVPCPPVLLTPPPRHVLDLSADSS